MNCSSFFLLIFLSHESGSQDLQFSLLVSGGEATWIPHDYYNDDPTELDHAIKQMRQHMSKSGWWFGTCFIFPYIGNVIIPTDLHMFQRGLVNHQPEIDGMDPHFKLLPTRSP